MPEPTEIVNHVRRGGRGLLIGAGEWGFYVGLAGFASLIFVLIGYDRYYPLPKLLVLPLGAAPWLILVGVWRQQSRWKLWIKTVQREHPGEWWRVDYHAYDATGSSDSRWEQVIPKICPFFATLSLLAAGCFLAYLFNAWGWWLACRAVLVGTALWGCFLLVKSVWWGLILLGQMFKYRTGRIEFRRFPFFPGDTLDVLLVWDDACQAAELCCRLECIQERLELTRHRSRWRYSRLAEVVKLVATDQLIQRELPDGTVQRTLPIRIPIPPNAPSTHLRMADNAVCWELDLSADVEGVNYHLRMLVPVYTRRRTERDEFSGRPKRKRKKRRKR